ncbi:CAP domain-containing protein [Streptomyces sp. ID05-04B]|uniref:CAP domain-containing protein n=1 Tax=Streptomyces sp. ID05-04B TaxID=3028661 RepID=UPI0029C27806|nr:CAP domain-containing protein [Streptomyces sp. ID05-04B]MDX5563608.1 CAP domain-containing protein [Streptomyces sp. ID05-04B]
MGRHRRSAAGRAATSRATGVTQTHGSHADSHRAQDAHTETLPTIGIAPYLNPEAYADSVARSQEYLYAEGGHAHGDTAVFAADGFTPDGGAHRPGANRAGAGRRRKRRVATPVKSGLLGVSAAVAIGTVAVATGVVPGIDGYRLGGGSGGSGDKVQAAAGSPTNSASEQGGTSGSADDDRGSASTSRDAGRSASPTAPAPPSASASSAAPTTTAPEKPESTPSKPPSQKPETTPSRSRAATRAPAKPKAPVTVSAEAQAAAEVLKLVNEERAKVGCSAVSANSSLSDLAEKFSDDMAARGFFDHTAPDGATPWDRAAAAGISGLGGENIARGQADAAAVMEAWMNSPGHKANILNCDFRTLGVGVHFGSGGPWWTQDFGY